LRVSAKAVYSKYIIEPASPINFGAMIKGTKKIQTVVLENKGTVNFKFRIHQALKGASALESKRYEKPCTEVSVPPFLSEEAPLHGCSLLKHFLQGLLNLGMFTVSPCSGSIGPWGQQKITVECLAGEEGTCEEQLYIDITGR
ncbi:HYDIN protein, partial [Spelaeornis formosus]|nr:HYDIN protein [Elachura formosa]